MQEVDEARPRRTQIGITFGRVGGLPCSAELSVRIQSAGSPVNFICLFLAVLGLHCSEGLSLVAASGEEEWGTKVNDRLVSLAYSMCSYILKG